MSLQHVQGGFVTWAGSAAVGVTAAAAAALPWVPALVGQVPAPNGTPTTIIGAFILGFATLIGLIVWQVRHLFSTTLPELTKTFDTNLAKVVEQCGKEQSGLRELFDRRQEQLQQHGMEWATREREASERRFAAVTAEMRGQHNEEMALVRELQQTVAEQQQMLRSLVGVIQQRTQMADAVHGAKDAIWIKTLEGVITGWNHAAERLLGWRSGEVVGKSVYTLVPPDLHAEEANTLERLRRGERVDRYNTERLHKDGRRVRLSLSVSPVLDPAGKVVGASSIAREA